MNADWRRQKPNLLIISTINSLFVLVVRCSLLSPTTIQFLFASTLKSNQKTIPHLTLSKIYFIITFYFLLQGKHKCYYIPIIILKELVYALIFAFCINAVGTVHISHKLTVLNTNWTRKKLIMDPLNGHVPQKKNNKKKTENLIITTLLMCTVCVKHAFCRFIARCNI